MKRGKTSTKKKDFLSDTRTHRIPLMTRFLAGKNKSCFKLEFFKMSK